MTEIQLPAVIDVRTVPPRDRPTRIVTAFDALAVGDALELTNDHDPKPLYFQFQSVAPGRFAWEYLQVGPEVWRVRIRKLADHRAGQCCGSCGG